MKLAGKIVKPQNSGNFDFHPLFKMSKQGVEIEATWYNMRYHVPACSLPNIYISIQSTIQSHILQVTLSVTTMGKKDAFETSS